MPGEAVPTAGLKGWFVDLFAIFRVALRSLRRHMMRSILTMLGIVIGIAAMVASVSFGEGANRMVQRQIENMGINLIYVFPGSLHRGGVRSGWGSYSTLTAQDVQAIARQCPAVKMVSAGVGGHLQVVYGGENWSTELDGVDTTFSQIRNWPMASGVFFSPEEIRRAADVVVIGQTVVDMLFGGQDPIGQTIRVRNLPFRVIGVLAEKGQTPYGADQDDRIEMPYTTAQKKLVGSPYLNFIAISAIDRDSVNLAMQEISSLLRERHRLRPGEDDDFGVHSMTQSEEVAAASGQVMTLLLASVASIALLVGGIGIMNIMLVSVTERTKEIGIRMATGATESDIRWQFILEAVALSVAGGLGGILFGVFLSNVIAHVFGWPSFISAQALTLAAVFSAAVGIFFGYYPAGKAASLDPIEALRFE
ncbi:MAG: ABC transporter permease [Terriglobia bacterium]